MKAFTWAVALIEMMYARSIERFERRIRGETVERLMKIHVEEGGRCLGRYDRLTRGRRCRPNRAGRRRPREELLSMPPSDRQRVGWLRCRPLGGGRAWPTGRSSFRQPICSPLG